MVCLMFNMLACSIIDFRLLEVCEIKTALINDHRLGILLKWDTLDCYVLILKLVVDLLLLPQNNKFCLRSFHLKLVMR